MDQSSAWLITLADVFTNLSAGWFGAALVVPLSVKKRKLRLLPLLTNILLGILFYGLATAIRMKF
jgi:hypothetical protein